MIQKKRVKRYLDSMRTQKTMGQMRTFASNMYLPLSILQGNDVSITSRFSKYTKDQISEYLKQPLMYEQQLRDVSIYMYANSMQYYKLINYYALMPLWAYTITPLKFDKDAVKPEDIYKQYLKVVQRLEIMNIQHEFIKVARTCFREDVFYGVLFESKDAFFIVKINPDICKISSIEDGVYNFAVDFSQITEDALPLYPEIFTQFWNNYQRQGDDMKWQEIPSDISICIKYNEDLPYLFPPFAASLELLYDIDDYADLIKERSKIDVYKLLHFQVPTDDDMEPMDFDLAAQYYSQAAEVVPGNIGLIMSPMQLSAVNFEKSGLADTDEVARAEERYWNATGTSPLLFGGKAASSVAALKESIRCNEQFVLAFMRQVERWLNRLIRRMSGKVKFKVNILPVTRFSQADSINTYKEAASLGLPVKTQYAALQNLAPNDVSSMAYLENDVLSYPELLVPLTSSYTQSSDGVGRPTNESQGKDLTPSGEQTQRDESNLKRGTGKS